MKKKINIIIFTLTVLLISACRNVPTEIQVQEATRAKLQAEIDSINKRTDSIIHAVKSHKLDLSVLYSHQYAIGKITKHQLDSLYKTIGYPIK